MDRADNRTPSRWNCEAMDEEAFHMPSGAHSRTQVSMRIEQSGEHEPPREVYLPSSFGELDGPARLNDALVLNQNRLVPLHGAGGWIDQMPCTDYDAVWSALSGSSRRSMPLGVRSRCKPYSEQRHPHYGCRETCMEARIP